MKYLFDTNISIYMINKKFEYLIDRVEKYGIENIGISSITFAELEYGIALIVFLVLAISIVFIHSVKTVLLNK